MRLLIEEMPHVGQGFNLAVKPRYINKLIVVRYEA